MAAYAAVVSLLNTVGKIQNHARLSASLDKKQVESLCDKVGFLKDFLKTHSHGGRGEAQADLEGQIASVASAAEDLIECHVAVRIQGGYTGHSNACLPDLQKAIEDVDAVKQTVMKTVKDLRLPRYSGNSAGSSSRTPPIGEAKLVGLEEQKNEIVERLIYGQPSRQVLPVVGMGGIGKTTLARSVYEDPRIVNYYDVKIWVTISQQNTVRDLLFQFPCCREMQTNIDQSVTDDQLGQKLYQSLFDRRYLIILDDMWSLEAWDNLHFFFPENGNSSRILVTTRLSNVAIYFGSCSVEMNFLDPDNCWRLFCDKVFGEQVCHPELVDIGKKIVKKCRGLPLSISIIGGLLAKSSMTQVHWESVAKDVNSILNSEDDEHCLSILSLSYSHLPIHLKPCFLYMGIFPEDRIIRVSLLTKLWIAEGFLEPENGKSSEEVAKDYLKDLVDRNVIMVRKWRLNGKIKTCYIHDLLRDLCLKVAQKEDFFYILKNSDSLRTVHGIHRLVLHDNSCMSISPYTRSVISFHTVQDGGFMKSVKNAQKLRVLNNVSKISDEDIFQQVNLRFISYFPDKPFELPSSVSLLWNLQVLICHNIREVYAPPEIWEMKELRHIDFPSQICLPDPLICRVDEGGNFVLKNLHTLKEIVNFRWSEEVGKRIPYIKKLKVCYRDYMSNWEPRADLYCVRNLSEFHKLESLNVYISVRGEMTRDLMQYIRFPCSLKKLTFGGSLGGVFRWGDLAIFGSLRVLEVLRIKCDVTGIEWNPNEEEFRSLKALRIDRCNNLIYWNADSCHFPVLENLYFDDAFWLDEIPLGIADISTLKSITLHKCKSSAAISAMKILKEQESFGNEGVEVQVQFKSFQENESFRAQVELQDLTSNHFRIKTRRVEQRWTSKP